jgi:hypothetical protein
VTSRSVAVLAGTLIVVQSGYNGMLENVLDRLVLVGVRVKMLVALPMPQNVGGLSPAAIQCLLHTMHDVAEIFTTAI